jgi:hypothetical protein
MTHHISAMLDVHPQAAESAEKTNLAECIAARFQCALTCTACADACLAEVMVADLISCIRTDLDCADICVATGAVMTRQTASNAGIRHRSWRPAAPPGPPAPMSARGTPRYARVL